MVNNHQSGVPSQQQDLDWERYRPLLLNPAFLGGLNADQLRILSVGQPTEHQNYAPKNRRFPTMHESVQNKLTRKVGLKDRIAQLQWFLQAAPKVPARQLRRVRP